MYQKVMLRMRERIHQQYYRIGTHADEEMYKDNLDDYDVELAILNGRIVERQLDRSTGEFKYRVEGRTTKGLIELLAKIEETGRLFIITV